MHRALLTALVLAGVAAPLRADRQSIEEVLEAARAAREAERASLRPEVESILAGVLEASAEHNQREVDRLRKKIVDLGTGAGLVLIDMLDPGLNAPLGIERRAREAAQVLGSMHGMALLPPLLAIAEEGSLEGRPRAIAVLGHWPDPAIVGPRLERIYESGRQRDREAALSALAQLGGESAERVFASALSSTDRDRVEQALIELGRFPDPELAVLVGPLIEDLERCAEFLAPLLDFFAGQPSELTVERAASLLVLVAARKLSDEQSVELLERLGTFDLDLRDELDERLEVLQGIQRRSVAEAASVCRARLGDAKALRSLEDYYTDRIDNSRDKEDPKPYGARAQMYLRVGRPKKAERDFDRAIVLDGGWGGFVDRDYYIGLARARAQQGKLSPAAKALEAAKLNQKEREQLAGDGDFAELVDSRYGTVLTEG
ncbi:hypothetical protein [Engelhardtia mirabilis]